MGGADNDNISLDILKVINEFKNIQVDLVTTTSNPNIKELKGYSANKRWINIHINSNKIAKLMKKSDLAIATPSVTLNEIYFMNVPFIAIKIVENQKDMYQFLKSKKFIVMKMFKEQELNKYINFMIKQYND
jgi:spore coat polysaccharide biosynthesis predicted glycosyltransferase SpsG